MEPLRSRLKNSDVTMAQLMGVVAAAAALCALVVTVRSLDDGSGLNILGVCCIGYTFYLVYLVWLSFSFFTRMQVLVLLTATAALAAVAIQVVAGATGWVVLVAIIALPIMPFVLGALMFRFGGHWEPEPEFESDTGTLALLVDHKRTRGLTPQQVGPSADPQAPRPPRQRMSRRTAMLLSVLLPVVLALFIGGTRLVRRRMHYQRLAAAQEKEEERCFEQVLQLEELNDRELAVNPDSPRVQARVERRKMLAEQWNKKADWHSARRRLYEDRW